VINVSIYSVDGVQKFVVHEGDESENVRDVTDSYEVRALVVEDDQGYVNGYHIGKRTTRNPSGAEL